MTNWLGLLISVIYIVLIISISVFCYKKKKFSLEDSRKFVHVGMCNWWLIAMIFFDQWIYACILPLLFVIINFINLKTDKIPGIERKGKDRTFGTVWYAIAMLILAFVLFRYPDYQYIGAIAILILGYGDGIGGLVSEYIGRHKFPIPHKTAEGSFTVFIISFIIAAALLEALAMTDMTITYAFFIACFATITELFSVGGIDNFTVPLFTALCTFLLMTEPTFLKFGIAFSITGIIVFVSMLNGLLTYGGGFAAMVLGTAVFYLNGPVVFWALILFFVTSAMLEHYHKKPKKDKVKDIRDVIENGLPCLLFGIMYYATGSEIALVCEMTAIAGVTADTWSSGLGYFSKEKVRSILTWKPIPKGESGGVTRLGMAGAVFGALFIALFSSVLGGDNIIPRFAIVFFFGVFTSLLDSLFGILLQVKYYDEKEGVILEKKPKSMKGIRKVSGYDFITNGMVNFLTSMIAALLAGMVAFLVF
ncbi:putative uncharacterized protein [Bacillus sp. CAG:988]|nr:putative uncharacterized protein [Bacillus sp. CAG:988]